MAPTPANIAISLLIRDGAEASNQSLQVHPYQLSSLSSWSLDPVLEPSLLNNLSLRDRDGQAGFGSRDSSQVMSMVMILLLIIQLIVNGIQSWLGEFLTLATQRLERRPISYIATSVVSLSPPRASSGSAT